MGTRAGRLLSWVAWLAALAGGARADGDFERRIPAEPGGRIEIEMDAGSIDVEGHEIDEVRVDARSSGFASDAVRFELDEGGGRDLRLSVRSSGLLGLFGGGRVRLHVRVPARFSVDARTQGGDVSVEEVEGEVRVQTSGGALEVNRIVGPVELETSGGGIRADAVRGELRARTTGGSIRAADVSGGLDVETSGGPLELRDVAGPVGARTSGGGIEVRFAGPPEGSIETSGGGIEVELGKEAGFDLDARASGGRVTLDPSLRFQGQAEPTRVEGAVNGGGARLELRSSGGHIVLRAR